MKIVKYISFLICMAIALMITSEVYVKYFISEIQMNNWSFHFDSNISDDIIDTIENLSSKNNVIVYSKKEKSSGQDITIYDIFETSSLETSLKYFFSSEIKSIIFGNIQINEIPLLSLNDINENTYFYVKGNQDDISAFVKDLEQYEELYSLNANITNYPKDCLKLIDVLWIVILLFLLFVTYYQVSVLKREKMISICYGNSPVLIVLKEIFSDFAFTVPVTLLFVFVMKTVFSTPIDRKLIIYLVLTVVVSAIPYFSYIRFNLQSISHENKLLERVVFLSKLFKLIITCMLLAVIVSVAYASESLIKSYTANSLMMKYTDYDVMKVSSKDLSRVPPEIAEIDNVLAQNYADRIAVNDLYSRYYEKCDITILDRHYSSDNYGEFENIYCNSNTKNYVFNVFSDYINDDNNSDVIFFLPKNQSNSNDRLKKMKSLLANYNKSKDYSEKIIYYDQNINFCFFNSDPENLIDVTENPYIIFDNTFPEISDNEYEKRLDMPVLVVKTNDELISELNTEDNMLKYTSYSLKENIEYMIFKYKKELMILVFIVLILMLLEIVMTYNIILFDYRLNTKEYCLKRSLGYGMLGKYKKQIIFLIVIYVISILIVCKLVKSNIFLVTAFGIVTMLIDVSAIIFFIILTEKRKVTKVLKGGFS